jgi:hypothetical protein
MITLDVGNTDKRMPGMRRPPASQTREPANDADHQPLSEGGDVGSRFFGRLGA